MSTLKMIVYVEPREKHPITTYEYEGNLEIGRTLKMISESLLRYPKEYPENIPLVSTWCGQVVNKIEIIQER